MNKSLWFTYRIFEPVLSLAILVHNVRFEKTFSLDFIYLFFTGIYE